jgi:uncharacterized protein (TIGR03437 family)
MFKFCLLPLLAIGVAEGQTVFSVVNAASGMIQGLPNGGIAQGSIFLVLGTDLGPSTLAQASSAFQTTTVGQTSISITVGSTTVNALMYYASATQVAALLPSNTPTGAGTLTLTYAGSPAAAVAIQVVQNNLGIFTISQNGQGVAIVTYPNGSLVSAIPGTGSLACPPGATVCTSTYGGAANPGQTLTLWGTGLGPVNGSDASGAGLGQPISIPSSTPLSVWVGGVAANVTYSGRSGYIGEDQINFTVPSNAPLGCAVPLAVQIGTEVSNFTAIPIASGSQSCTMQSPAFSSSAIQALTTNAPGYVNYASFQMGRSIAGENSSGIFYDDLVVGNFAQVSVGAVNQPTVLSSLDIPPLGTCTTYTSNSSGQPLFSVVTGIDAGKIVITGPPPDFQVTLQEQPGTGQATGYSAVLSPTGVYFSGGAYTIAAAGGADVGKFSTGFTITQTPTWPSSNQSLIDNNNTGLTRANGVTLKWTGGSSAYWVVIGGGSTAEATDTAAGTVSASFSCWVPSTAGSFTVPASVMLSLPGAALGALNFMPTLPPQGFSASGLDVGILQFQYLTSFNVPFN